MCRFFGADGCQVDKVKGESLSDAVWARWRALCHEDRLKILTHVDSTDPAFRKDPSSVVSGLIHMKDGLVFGNATGSSSQEALKQTAGPKFNGMMLKVACTAW